MKLRAVYYGWIMIMGTFCLMSSILSYDQKPINLDYPQSYPQRPAIIGILYKLLEDFDQIMKVGKVPYFIIAGTLLGAVRSHELIPWDDDLDVAIFLSDFDKFIHLKETFAASGYLFCPHPREPICTFKVCPKDGFPYSNAGPWVYRYPWIDVMVWTLVDGKYTYLPNGCYKHLLSTSFFYYNELFPLCLYKIKHLTVYGPNNPIPYLDRCYPGWQTLFSIWSGHRT